MTSTATGRPVSFPFRVFAGFILVLMLIVGIGTPIMLYKHVPEVSPLKTLLMLPLMASFFRLFWYVTTKATAPADYAWPFASRNVAGVYILIVYAYTWFN